MATPTLEFTVRRGTPSLVVPARPTPRELKLLSDIDDQESMRIYSAVIHLFRGDPSRPASLDPAAVVRAALAEALVHYYPLAGRLREGPGRKLAVECAGQGVVLVEADADVAADELGDVRCPPFPRSQDFLYDDGVYRAPRLPAIIDRPLLYVQVTQLKCGGFILGQRLCHCMADAPGLMQFWKAVGELARGAGTPSVTPVWAREVFDARLPPRPSFPHVEYREPAGHDRIATTPSQDMVRVPFVFGPGAIADLRSRAAPAAGCSWFDLVTACLWRSRTAALGYAPDDEVRLSTVVNARGRRDAFPHLPAGFYGNAFAYAVAACTAGELCRREMEYAVGLIREAKARVTYEYMKSVADLMVLEERPLFAYVRTLIVSDVSRAGFGDVDLGWGEAVYGGPASAGGGIFLGVNTYVLRRKNGKGEEEMVVPVCLPRDSMDRFRMEVEVLTKSGSSKL